jgi:thiaminase/transcriptional activator TenA
MTDLATPSIADTLWHENQSVAIACLQHPFVQGIADGTLPTPTFAYYVGQDAFFLEAFARAYSIAAAKSPDQEGFEQFHQLASGVLQELRLHHHYAAEWGVDLQQVVPGAATCRYTDFLLATAWSQDGGLATAAMLPCMQLYAFLGAELARAGIPDHAYGAWIRTYADPEFHALAEQLAQLAERYCTLNAVSRRVYHYAMVCELDFFQAAWEVGAA